MHPTNWAGNYRYRAQAVHRPTTLDQVCTIVARTPQLRVLGSRHSFTAIADSAEVLTLDRLPTDVVVDRAALTVSVGGAIRYGELAEALQREGLALANLASLPHISVAGAISTATHGSGDRNGNLASAVAGLELVTSEGRVLEASRGDPEFDGLVVGLGALGALTRVTLDVEPVYEVRQRVFERLSWEALSECFDQITAAGYSVSAFTLWGESIDQLWVKSRVTESPETVRETLFDAAAATGHRHPIRGLDPINCTPQLGIPGWWSERLPHFRMGFTPSAGDEIQSEYLLPRAHAIAAISALRGLAETIRPLLQISEIRTIAADGLWMSPAYRDDMVGLHFTWGPDEAAVRRALVEVEAALIPLGARPHWGKLFLAGAETLGPRYERLPDFIALMERLDPRGAFHNDWLREHVTGG